MRKQQSGHLVTNAIMGSTNGAENYSAENESRPSRALEKRSPRSRRLVTRMRRDIIPGACSTDTSRKSHSARYPGVLLSDDMPVNNSPGSCSAMTFAETRNRDIVIRADARDPYSVFGEGIYIINSLHRGGVRDAKRALTFINSSTVHKTSVFFLFF